MVVSRLEVLAWMGLGLFNHVIYGSAFLPSTSLFGGPKQQQHRTVGSSTTIEGKCLLQQQNLHLFSQTDDNDDDAGSNSKGSGEGFGSNQRRKSGTRGGPEKSQMKKFIDRYVEKNRGQEEEESSSSGDDNDDAASNSIPNTNVNKLDKKEFDVTTFVEETSTHLIAIPMDSSHELLLELESVQRAILYHCPILTDACIPGSMTRLPLLYVEAPKQTNSAYVTSILTDVVQELIQNHLFDTYGDDEFDDIEAEPEFKGVIEGEEEEEFVNNDGYKPVTITFQSLEIDGSNNNVLNTVGMANEYGTKKLSQFVNDLQTTIESKFGWRTSFPSDPQTTTIDDEGGGEKDQAPRFRPRIAFMELPKEFDTNLSKLKNKDTDITDEDMEFLTSDQGGNGISPIFWCQWWDDVFGRNTRLQEVGIYPRTENQQIPDDDRGLSYTSFYLPYEVIPLPDGSPGMLKSEKKFQKYQDERLAEEQQLLLDENEGSGEAVSPSSFASSPSSKLYEEADILMTKTRDRLEKIYLESDAEREELYGLENEEEKSSTTQASDDDGNNLNDDDEEDIVIEPITASPDDFIDDWMKERIQNVVAGDDAKEEELKSEEKLHEQDILFEDDSNSVYQQKDQDGSSGYYMDEWMKQRIEGMVGELESVKSRTPQPKKEKPPIADNPVFKAYKEGTLVPKSKKTVGKKKELPPYPSREHFIGIWKVITSPTGFPAEEPSDERSENLILRIDGTTAGGPILDPETNQKAAGGTWKMIDNGNGSVKLRLRLVIPPKKERVIEMVGEVERFSTDMGGIPMTSKAFGVPHLEEMATRARKGENSEDMMHCSGEVSSFCSRFGRYEPFVTAREPSLTRTTIPIAQSHYT